MTDASEGRVTLTTDSADATRRLAASLAAAAEPGDRIFLLGDLGAGKTQFAKGFAVGLGVGAVVNSPSFTLMAEYDGRLRLFHLDLFRLAGTADAFAGGLLDERQETGVSVIEWADRLEGPVGAADLDVRLDGAGDDLRTITLAARSPSGERYVRVARTLRSGGGPA